MEREDRGAAAWVAMAMAAAVGGLTIVAQQPPAAQAADGPPGMFSAGRAMAHVEEIARAPHPMGSTEGKRVRAVLSKKLGDLGLKAEDQPLSIHAIEAANVLARIRGTGPAGKKALLLCAHYDSVHAGPGAGDNASGVAAVLETLRALQTGPPLERDLIVLFDDGEEAGLIGAGEFVEKHPWTKEVGVVLNLDARGNSGPSVMFETSDGNAWLIAEYAKAAPHPLAASLSMEIYRLLPNDTNLTVFKKAGLAGLNFAFVGGLGYYHTPGDTPRNLSPRTLQHQGENVLAMARHFGRLDLDNPKRDDDVIYSSILSRGVVIYPRTQAWPLAATAVVLFLVALGLGIWRGRLGLLDLIAGVVVWFVAWWASVFAVAIFWLALQEILAPVGVLWTRIDVPDLTACAVVASCVTLALDRRAAWRWSLAGLGLGALAWWVALAVATTRWVPGASYLFVVPAIGGLVGLCLASLFPNGSIAGRMATLVGALPALVLMTPMILSTFESLSLRMAAPLMTLVVLFLGAMLPLLGPLVSPGRTAPSTHPFP